MLSEERDFVKDRVFATSVADCPRPHKSKSLPISPTGWCAIVNFISASVLAAAFNSKNALDARDPSGAAPASALKNRSEFVNMSPLRFSPLNAWYSATGVPYKGSKGIIKFPMRVACSAVRADRFRPSSIVAAASNCCICKSIKRKSSIWQFALQALVRRAFSFAIMSRTTAYGE